MDLKILCCYQLCKHIILLFLLSCSFLPTYQFYISNYIWKANKKKSLNLAITHRFPLKSSTFFSNSLHFPLHVINSFLFVTIF